MGAIDSSALKFSNKITSGVVDDEYFDLKASFIYHNCKTCFSNSKICDCHIMQQAIKLENRYKEKNMKTYGYLPVIKKNEVPELTDHPEYHNKRYRACVTEMVANLAQIQNEDIRAILSRYHAVLIELEDGSRTLGVDFPEKRFS